MATGFNFGAKTTAPPAFGTGSITFGTAPTQNPTPQFGLGAPTAQPSAGGGFQFAGATTAAPNLFGTLTNTTAGNVNFNPGFGTPATTTGLFGTPSAPTATVTGLSFATPSTSAPPLTGFGFGTPAASTSVPTLSFGTPASTAAPVANRGLTFGPAATSAPTTGPTFGNAPVASSAGGLFGNTTISSAPTLGLSFGSTAINSVAPVLNFGAATTASTPSLNFGLSTTGTTAQTGLSFGLGGASTTVTTATAAPVVTGLGGVATSQMKTGTAVTTQKEVPPKDQQLPNEILQTVEQFKEMVKQQKLHSSDIARCSVRDFRKVEQEIDLLSTQINEVECQLQKNRHMAEKLKYDTAKCLQDIEMAQRTQDMPPGLQYENIAPLQFFVELVDQFERDMHSLKIQIDSADKYVKNHKSPESLAPQDLATGMRRLHDTFVALAGRLQSVHSQVESQKEMYINLRKHVYNDPNNPFDKLNKPMDVVASNLKKNVIYSPPKVACGPTPFNNLALSNGNIILQQQQQQQQQQQSQAPPAYPSANTSAPGFGVGLSFGAPQSCQPPNTSLFGNTFGQSTSFQLNNSNFQLQKPPTGNKRGKQ